jgi:hypothetical protein
MNKNVLGLFFSLKMGHFTKALLVTLKRKKYFPSYLERHSFKHSLERPLGTDKVNDVLAKTLFVIFFG